MTTTNTARQLSTEEAFPPGREIIWDQLRRQIGMNLLAISGGRWAREGASTIRLPAGAGFHVFITLEADDTYTVRRVFIRGGKMFDHGVRRDVYAEEISEVAYFCSCFRSYSVDEWMTQS
jgi:hypothetical protein